MQEINKKLFKLGQKNQSVFAFFKSYPIVKEVETEKEIIIKSAGPFITLSQTFKKDLIEHLKQKNKQISLVFQTLNEETFEKLIKNNLYYRVLQLDFEILEPNGIVLEFSKIQPSTSFWSFNRIKNMLKKS